MLCQYSFKQKVQLGRAQISSFKLARYLQMFSIDNHWTAVQYLLPLKKIYSGDLLEAYTSFLFRTFV